MSVHDDKILAYLGTLERGYDFSTRQVADHLGVSAGVARRALNKLWGANKVWAVDRGASGKMGNAVYWSLPGIWR